MGADRFTLLDIAKQTDPNGKPARVIEVWNQTNAIIQDAPAYPSNAPMGNRVTIRSSLPTVGFAKVNQGVIRSKSSTEQKVDTIGLIAALSEVDAKIQKIVGAANFDAARWKEDKAFLEAISQLAALTAFYGDERVAESSFTGLATRMPSLATALTGSQVWSYSTVSGGDGTSIYVVDWGEDTCHLIFPPATIAGVDSRDKGELRVTDVDGNPMMAFVNAYDWMIGLSVEDPRHIGRLANIDISDAQTDTAFKLAVGTASTGGLIDLLTAMPDPGSAQRVMYTHQRIFAAFYKQAINKSNAALTIRDYMGKPTPYFWDVPIRRCDQISGAESTVS
jgi:hypothetical protein